MAARRPLTSLLSMMQNYPKSFDSGGWTGGYNPDVTFVSTTIASMCRKGVLDPIHVGPTYIVLSQDVHRLITK